MYIYHALINALSAHMIHINLQLNRSMSFSEIFILFGVDDVMETDTALKTSCSSWERRGLLHHKHKVVDVQHVR